MNTKERFMNALRLQPVDRPPVAAVVTGITVQMMEKSGIFWPEAHTDATKLAGLAETIWLYAQIECIKLPFCMTIEVEALGASINYRTIDTLPTEVGHIFNHPDELTIPTDFLDRNRVPTVLKAITQLRRRYDNEVAIVSSIVGPFALAAKLFGFENFLIWIITDPDYVHQIMEKLTPLAIKYAKAQVEAGADIIVIGEATCSGDLISPNTYRDFIAPYHSQLCPSIPAPTIMHICGKSTRHVPYLVDIGTDVYNFDEGVDINVAREYLKGKVAIAGYVPTVGVLLQGTPEDVYRASLECLDNGVDILTPGCSMAPHTPLENIGAMVQAAHDWSQSEMQKLRSQSWQKSKQERTFL
jgi:[methyl-Co(III) methanol-specific corrinoid protein]:coenzyme M methyltransferase